MSRLVDLAGELGYTWLQLETGDVPSFRADQLPYGGVKASGVGREGVRSAMDDFTYERVLVLTGIAL